MQAAAWLDPKRKRKNLVPEYLHLGPEHHDEKAVIAWLKQEVKRWPHQPVSKNCKWFHATPTYFLG
jgi:hypothetical protein